MAVLVLLTVPLVRQYTVPLVIMTMANKFGIFPKASDTERAALEAGTVWMDKELFSGNPDIKKMMTQDIQGLSAEEQAFSWASQNCVQWSMTGKFSAPNKFPIMYGITLKNKKF